MTMMGAPASASGSSSAVMSAEPNSISSSGSVSRPRRSASARSATLASTKTARIGGSVSGWRESMAMASTELGHRLAEADRSPGLPLRIEAQRALRKQQHDGRAEHEAAHLVALPQRDLAFWIEPFARASHARRIDRAVPDRRHAADNGRADERKDEAA